MLQEVHILFALFLFINYRMTLKIIDLYRKTVQKFGSIYPCMLPPYQGFFIFLTMVVKEENMKGMREQASKALSSYGIISPSASSVDSSLVKQTVL